MWLQGARLLTNYYFTLEGTDLLMVCYYPFYVNTSVNVNPIMLLDSDIKEVTGSSGNVLESPSGIAWSFLSDDEQPWISVQLKSTTIILGLILGN